MIRRMNSSSASAANEAERLIETARIAHVLLQRGATIDNVSGLLRCSVEYCRFALAFNKANDATKLRALVEVWPLEVIKRERFYEGCSFDACKTVP